MWNCIKWKNKMATSDGCSGSSVRRVPSFTFAMHWHELRSRSIGKCCVRTFIFVFMSTMQGKIVGKMCGNVLYHSGIVILLFPVPYVQIRVGFDFHFFFLNFSAVKAAPRLFDIFSFKYTAAFTPANTVMNKLGMQKLQCTSKWYMYFLKFIVSYLSRCEWGV